MIKRVLITSVCVFAILFGIVMLTAPVISVLSISNRKTQSQRIFYSIKNLDDFVISYTHSVNKGMVHDYYSIDNNGVLILNQTEFVSYGAGIPEPEETPGASFSVEGNTYLIKNIDRKLEKLVMAVGVTANHTIRFDFAGKEIGSEIPLKNYFEPQTSLVLKVKKVSILDYIFHKI